jgi:pimeloyl-ACP methyl ester carboxylesterase/photosystem II stability/assembly factor-like uncharacterized protein
MKPVKRINTLIVAAILLVNNLVVAGVLDTWTLRNFNPSQFLTGLTFGKGNYFVVGQQGLIMSSPDGVNWTTQNSGTTIWLADIVYANNIFVIVGQSGLILTSYDGISWTPCASGTTSNFNRLRFLNGQFIAVGDQSTILISTDGINWTRQNAGSSSPYRLYYAIYANGLYVITGQGDPILVSTDTVHWTPEYIGENNGGDVAYGNGIFVNVVTGGQILTSPNGLSWTSQGYLPAGNGFSGVTFAEGNFVGEGSGQTIFSSTDGTNWVQRFSGNPSFNLWNVKYVNGTFMAVGDNGTILQTGSLIGTPPVPPTLVPTNRTPTSAEIGSQTNGVLRMFANGAFTNVFTLDPSKITIVLTHGWNSSSTNWPSEMASNFVAGGISANIVAWDWRYDAASDVSLPGARTVLLKTPAEGYALGTNLLQNLGAGYSQPIHFIGHSFGTEVNAAAANYLEANGYSGANIQMTLFDEAEIANLTAVNPTTLNLSWITPLPTNFVCSDNYISLVGRLQENAKTVNIFLTEGQPGTFYISESNLLNDMTAYHGVPCQWYAQTITNPSGSVMGDVWSFERNSNFTSPAGGTYFEQQGSGLVLNQIQPAIAELIYNNINLPAFARDILVLLTLKGSSAAWNTVGDVTANVVDWTLSDPNPVFQTTPATIGISTYAPATPDFWSPQLVLQNHPLNFQPNLKSSGIHPLDNPSPTPANSPAYAWLPMTIPTNVTSMSFDFMLQGDGASDSVAAALNGTNVFSLAASLIQTNVTMNSGLIDVSQYAGTNVELFLGIVGGTSTNTSLTVSGIRLYSIAPPSLQAQASGNNFVLMWPLSASDYTLENSTDLISWTTNTDISAIVNLQNTITNSISDGARFYRLKK